MEKKKPNVNRCLLTVGFMLVAGLTAFACDVKVVANPSEGTTSLSVLSGKHTRQDAMRFLHGLLKTLPATEVDGRGSVLKVKLYLPIDKKDTSVKDRICNGE